MTNNASEFVGDIPKNYDQCLGPIIFDAYADNIAAMATKFAPQSVLELAAGSGIVSRKLRDAIELDAQLTVTDLNAPMLEVARAKFRRDENVSFTAADAMKLDFPDNQFDLIVCQFGVMFFPDKPQSFREALRVLRPGGVYLFNTWGDFSANPFAKIAHDVCLQYFPENPPGFYKVPFSYSDGALVKEHLAEAGFADIKDERRAIEQPVPDWARFSHGLVFGNPLIDEIRSRGGVDAQELAAAIETALRKKFGLEPSAMPLAATIFKGRAP